MNKSMKTVIAVVCAVVVIAVLCIAIVFTKNGKKEPVVVAQLTGITEISFNNSSEDLAFQKEGDTWYYKEDKNFPLKQEYLTKMEETFSDLTGEVADKAATDLTGYGLDQPIYKATAVTSDGTSTTILIGNLASGNSCFAMKEGENVVYTIPTKLGEESALPLYALIELEKFPELEPSQITSITLNKHGKVLQFVKKGEDWYRDSSDSEENKIADTKNIETIAAAICELKNRDCVNYKVVEKQLNNYGLNQPTESIAYTYEKDGAKGSVNLLVGSADAKDDYYYTKLEDSNQVNRISKALIEPCLYTEAE